MSQFLYIIYKRLLLDVLICKGVNMKKLSIFLIFSLLSVEAIAKDYCYSYSISSFNAYKGNSKRADKKVGPIKSVIVRLLKPISKMENRDDAFSIITKVAGKIYSNNWLMCYRADEDIHQCGGECDSAQLVLDKYMNMRFWYTNFEKETSNTDEPEIDIELDAKDKASWLKPSKVNCPATQIKKKNSHNLFVCYSSKTVKNAKPIYNNCQRVNSVCDSLGLKHFGHYINKKDAQDALQRCKSSKPKFVD